jgi:hypothetical protein
MALDGCGRGRETDDSDEEDLLVAEPVADLADRDQRDRQREQIARPAG